MTDNFEESKTRLKKANEAIAVPTPGHPPIPKWEYDFVLYNRVQLSNADLEKDVSKRGGDGWELAAITKPRGVAAKELWVFKRPYYS
ncbi:MAG: hypothetical protein ABSB41_12510 [Anaerolineales bacterium]|jgi:hypothetical protein